MKPTTAIQKFIAALFVLIFSISIAPKKYFHDLIANHKDGPSCIEIHKSAVLHTKGYNCHCDNFVVHAPYLLQKAQPTVRATLFPKEEQSFFYSASFQSFIANKENRGPPALI